VLGAFLFDLDCAVLFHGKAAFCSNTKNLFIPHHIRINCSFEINERIQNALDALIQCIYPEAFE
jgi:hypothetical protein